MSEPTIPTVTFTLTKFHKVGGSNKYCSYTMSLAGGGDVVTLDPKTNTLTVASATPVQIAFTAAGNYLLSGICFRETDGSGTDPIGSNCFPNTQLSLSSDEDGNYSSVLTLDDQMDGTESFEFALLVVGLDEKALGLIDPPIYNKPPQ